MILMTFISIMAINICETYLYFKVIDIFLNINFTMYLICHTLLGYVWDTYSSTLLILLETVIIINFQFFFKRDLIFFFILYWIPIS